MAKGVEDTALYRYVRLLALNEVGGDPGRFSLGVDGVPCGNSGRAERFPHALLAGTTHDTSAAPTCERGSGNRRHPRSMARACADAGTRSPAGSVRAGAGLDRGAFRLPDHHRRVADRRRSICLVPPQGAPRGKEKHELGRAQRGVGRRCDPLRDRLAPNDEFLESFDPRCRDLGSRRTLRPRAACPAPHLAGSSRYLRRRRGAAVHTRRSRQPPSGRLGATATPPRRARRNACCCRREAVGHPGTARTSRAAAVGLRRHLRAGRSGAGHMCVPPREQRTRGGLSSRRTPKIGPPNKNWRDVLGGLPNSPAAVFERL